MGEILLAHDPVCSREVAIKKIRDDLVKKKMIQNRFLREARIASKLTHPSIIPIYTIHADPKQIYYTMPYVEGETVKEIIRKAKEQSKEGDIAHPLGGSIPELMRIFLMVCEAIAYTHAQGFLHRDIKPDNVIAGKYGEVLILDWGIAEKIDSLQEDEEDVDGLGHDLTKPGKVAGTLSYMAPERALGKPASISTEIYSLGVMLYELLTLHLPFTRPALPQFRKIAGKERLINPLEMAPYREIPHHLSEIAKKCLAKPKDRYETVDLLISDLKNYLEGRPEWILVGELDMQRKKDWEFQENILLAKHTAITQTLEMGEWVSVMLSKQTFAGNIKLEAKVHIKQKGNGIGFLFSVPESKKRLEEGYCFWIGSKNQPGCQLYRSNVLVVDHPETSLSMGKENHIVIEKVDEHMHIYLNKKLVLTFLSHIPLAGTHVGLLHRDTEFSLENLEIYSGSHNVMVNCLAVPDAFLSHKDYDTALSEYRRIGRSFPGRTEGREALFRAGMTLLEQAKVSKTQKDKDKLYQQALEEFENLHNKPGAPLEYLGKSLVYAELNDEEEEAKCLELAVRKFPKHPLLPILEEHIVYRLHESSLENREGAYRLLLLVVSHLSKLLQNPDTQKLIESLKQNWEPISFIEKPKDPSPVEERSLLTLQLAYCLSRKQFIHENIEKMAKSDNPPKLLIANGLFCLLELGFAEDAKDLLAKNRKVLGDTHWKILEVALMVHFKSLDTTLKRFFQIVPKKWSHRHLRTFVYVIQTALDQRKTKGLLDAFDELSKYQISDDLLESIDVMHIWTALYCNEWGLAESILHHYSLDDLNHETTPLHFLYGCYLQHSEEEDIAKIHFSGVLEVPFPRSPSLLSHFVLGKINEKKGWIKQAFYWEKRELYRQLALYYHCVGNEKKKQQYLKKAMQHA